MKDLVRRGMAEGAFGLSSGLFYVPGSFAKTEEVIELTKVAAESGGLYTSHVRDEGNYDAGVRASVREVIRIAEEAKTVGIVSHMKALGRDSWGLAPDVDQGHGGGARARRAGVSRISIRTRPRRHPCARRWCRAAWSRRWRS